MTYPDCTVGAAVAVEELDALEERDVLEALASAAATCILSSTACTWLATCIINRFLRREIHEGRCMLNAVQI